MALENPPQQKRKLEINTTTFLKEVASPVYYIKVDGKFVPVDQSEKYVPPSECSSDDDDDYVDPLLEKEYYLQLVKSDYFDLNIHIPNGHYHPFDWTNESCDDWIGMYGRMGLHWYNFQKGSNLRLVRFVKYVEEANMIGLTFHITMEVMDPANDSHFTFQTCVEEDHHRHHKKGDSKLVTKVCRIKPKPESSEVCYRKWNDQLMNGFNDGNLEWLPDDALTQSGDKHKQYYELQESEIQENNWLNLYTEFAFYSILTKKDVPLKIKKVVVQTHEDVEPSKKLKSGNAIFYIIYSDCTKDYATIVKRTTDGIEGHLALDFKFRAIRGFE